MKLIQKNLFYIIILSALIKNAQSGKDWDQTENIKLSQTTQMSIYDYAVRHWIISKSAYCPEQLVENQTCEPCKTREPLKQDGTAKNLAKSWIHSKSIVYVQYDNKLNKVIVSFRGTEGISAIEDWRINLDFLANIIKCVPLKAGNRFYLRFQRNQKKKNKQMKRYLKNYKKFYPFFEQIKINLEKFKIFMLKTSYDVKEIANAFKESAIQKGQTAYDIAYTVVTDAYHTLSHLQQITLGEQATLIAKRPSDEPQRSSGQNYDCYMHHGIWANLNGIMHVNEVYDYVKELYKEKNASGISFTGHSLGGGMATAAASSFLFEQIKQLNQKEEPEMIVSSLVTFGSLTIGDLNFQEWFDKACQDLNVTSLRFINNNDPVTRPFGYTHVGRAIRYDSSAKKYTDCGIKKKVNDTNGYSDPECQVSFKIFRDKMLKNPLKAIQILKKGLHDHGDYFKGVQINKKEVKFCGLRTQEQQDKDAVFQEGKEETNNNKRYRLAIKKKLLKKKNQYQLDSKTQ